MKQNLSKLNQTSCLVEHTVALKKFIYNSSQRYVIFMRDVMCKQSYIFMRRFVEHLNKTEIHTSHLL
jgi:hypothetical protein